MFRTGLSEWKWILRWPLAWKFWDAGKHKRSVVCQFFFFFYLFCFKELLTLGRLLRIQNKVYYKKNKAPQVFFLDIVKYLILLFINKCPWQVSIVLFFVVHFYVLLSCIWIFTYHFFSAFAFICTIIRSFNVIVGVVIVWICDHGFKIRHEFCFTVTSLLFGIYLYEIAFFFLARPLGTSLDKILFNLLP